MTADELMNIAINSHNIKKSERESYRQAIILSIDVGVDDALKTIKLSKQKHYKTVIDLALWLISKKPDSIEMKKGSIRKAENGPQVPAPYALTEEEKSIINF